MTDTVVESGPRPRQPTRVLITGGAGFLGMHLTECFRRAKITVRLLDLAERPTWSQAPEIEYVRGDIRDGKTLAIALSGVDAVVHAAFVSPRQTQELIYSVNVEGTRTLCAQVSAHGVQRLILLSSTIVQWPPKVHPFFSDSPLTRLDAYRASRVEAEQIVVTYERQGLRSALVRPKTFIGPGRVSAFALIFEWIRIGRPVPVLGGGENRYQLLDIRDMVEGIRLLAATDVTGVFSLGAREFCTVHEDLQSLLDHARTGARLWTVPGWAGRRALRMMELCNLTPLSEWHYKSASGHDAIADIGRAERELGWRPQRSNAQALMEAYDWYVATLRSTGIVNTTQPIPLGHRLLKVGLQWILLR